MNKGNLIETVAKGADVSKAVAEKVINVTLEAIKGALKKKDKVLLVGFGTFLVKKRSARTCVNPQTKKKMTIKAKNVPAFRPGKELKDAIK